MIVFINIKQQPRGKSMQEDHPEDDPCDDWSGDIDKLRRYQQK